MRVRILTRINLENTGPNREPAWIEFDPVEKITVEEGKLLINYTVLEKEGIQHLELSVDKLHEVTLEFF